MRKPCLLAIFLFFALCAPAPAQDEIGDAVTNGNAADNIPSDEGDISPEVQAIINTPGTPAIDQGQNDITPPNAPPAPPESAGTPRKPEFEDMPQVELRILDKVRAESRTYILNVGRTVAYANIRIRPRACRKSSPLDDPENAAFLQIWEVKPDSTSAWIFSGWMFSSSPSLSAMDHPVYDVTVLDCKNPMTESQSESSAPTTGEAAPGESPDAKDKPPEKSSEKPVGAADPMKETPAPDPSSPGPSPDKADSKSE